MFTINRRAKHAIPNNKLNYSPPIFFKLIIPTSFNNPLLEMKHVKIICSSWSKLFCFFRVATKFFCALPSSSEAIQIRVSLSFLLTNSWREDKNSHFFLIWTTWRFIRSRTLLHISTNTPALFPWALLVVIENIFSFFAPFHSPFTYPPDRLSLKKLSSPPLPLIHHRFLGKNFLREKNAHLHVEASIITFIIYLQKNINYNSPIYHHLYIWAFSYSISFFLIYILPSFIFNYCIMLAITSIIITGNKHDTVQPNHTHASPRKASHQTKCLGYHLPISPEPERNLPAHHPKAHWPSPHPTEGAPSTNPARGTSMPWL